VNETANLVNEMALWGAWLLQAFGVGVLVLAGLVALASRAPRRDCDCPVCRASTKGR
jgi:hypothetical protein